VVAVVDLFARFRDCGSPGNPVLYRGNAGFGHIDPQVLEKVADLFPNEFGLLVTFAEQHEHFTDAINLRFAREAQFVVAVLESKDRLATCELPMCFPRLLEDHGLSADGCFEAALAAKMPGAQQSRRLVSNSNHARRRDDRAGVEYYKAKGLSPAGTNCEGECAEDAIADVEVEWGGGWGGRQPMWCSPHAHPVRWSCTPMAATTAPLSVMTTAQRTELPPTVCASTAPRPPRAPTATAIEIHRSDGSMAPMSSGTSAPTRLEALAMAAAQVASTRTR
jgi:hypothetical protein